MTKISDDQLKSFYRSWEWKRARYQCLKSSGGKCECCGRGKAENAVLSVDHIKPLRFFWELRLDQSNLQVLCNSCNMGKGFKDKTDWREPSESSNESSKGSIAEEIEAKKTANGGWTRETLAQWGVPWPPPKGWKKKLEAGGSISSGGTRN